jgi:hypothetical protein
MPFCLLWKVKSILQKEKEEEDPFSIPRRAPLKSKLLDSLVKVRDR